MIKVAVKVQLKKEVLDTRGRALLKLMQKEHPSIKDCFYGKYIELSIEEKDQKKALAQAKQIAQDLLCNDLIESFELEVLK